MLTLSHLIDDLHLGRPATHGGLTVFPLLCSDPADPPEYELLDDAVALGSVQITEISESGSVSELLVWNNGDKPVLIVDGQELLGAKQNRVINLTVLAPERSKTTIPVSCVEAGRWSFSSNEFRPAPHTQFAAGRAAKAVQVTGAMETSGERRSNQTAVWDVIAQRSAQMSVRSDTGAMAAMYLQSAPQIDEYAAAFEALPGQVGAAFLSCGQITGIDIFDRFTTFASILPKLIRSYALDVIDVLPSSKTKDRSATVTSFLAKLAKSKLQVSPAVGVGMDVRLKAGSVSGGGLLAFQRLVHLYAFRNVTASQPSRNTDGTQSRIARGSRRSRNTA